MFDVLKKELFANNGPLANLELESVSEVSGGCIHRAWKLDLKNNRTVFLKANSTESFPMLKFEAECLKSLREFANSNYLVIPEPIKIAKLKNASVIILPWLNIGNGDQLNLGKGLAMLHKISSSNSQGRFGWETDGYIGSGPQLGGWMKKWGDYFVKLRLLPQLKLAEKWGLENFRESKFIESIKVILNSHSPEPSLLHGDLWSGNAGTQKDMKGVLIDPATYWGDREVDIAMTKLFGRFSNNFYLGYESIWPLSQSARDRTTIYNLYHLLNHANLFGGSYQNECITSIKRLQCVIYD